MYAQTSIKDEARIFRLKVWQTPSFLFVAMGITTMVLTVITYLIASRYDDPLILVASIAIVAAVTFSLGYLIVQSMSRVIIINNARQEFLSVATHQLRSPLTGLRYSFDLLLSGKAGDLTDLQREVIELGKNDNERLLLLVKDLLDSIKLSYNETQDTVTSFDIASIVRDVCSSFTSVAKHKHMTVQLFPEATRAMISGDAEKIRFVVQNILDNAFKYTNEGGAVLVGLTQQGRYCILEISDNGIGIPEAERGRLFNKFFRASNVGTNTVGTGLGLYIAKSIIDRLGGTIWIGSTEGSGTTVRVQLPCLTFSGV